MDCPRCDGPLITYSLEERTRYVCEGCGYVGVPADHHAEGDEEEPWSEALRRFRERFRERD